MNVIQNINKNMMQKKIKKMKKIKKLTMTMNMRMKIIAITMIAKMRVINTHGLKEIKMNKIVNIILMDIMNKIYQSYMMMNMKMGQIISMKNFIEKGLF